MQKYYITESLGEVQKMTPEGYLLCVGVPIARTGDYEYLEKELPGYKGNDDGIIKCERSADVVFADATIASFEGKPFVVGHPSVDVDITNWNDYAAGVIQNVRKGEKSQADLLIADILVTNPDAIKEIESGVREVSCGYDADYEQVEPGKVIVKEIIGNHVALVELGRAGHRVAIGDKKSLESRKENGIQVKDKETASFLERLKGIFSKAKVVDEGIVLEIGTPDPHSEEKPEDVFDFKGAFDTLGAQLCGKIEDLISTLKAGAKASDKKDEEDPKEEDPPVDDEDDPEEDNPEEKDSKKDKKKDKKTGDSAKNTVPAKQVTPTVDAKVIMSLRRNAEILSPGFDVKSLTLDSNESVTDAMRKVLAEACLKDSQVKREVEAVYENVIRSWSAVEDSAIKVLFNHAAKIKSDINNKGAIVTSKDFAVVGNRDVMDLKKIHEDFWKNKEAK